MSVEPALEHPALTPREREILVALLDGAPTNRELAQRLGIAESSVASRLHRLYQRHNLHGRSDAMRLAALHRSCCLPGDTG